ncbi:MAG: hypothetical protein ACM3O3_12635 [Syntrophothermus sp.]
MINIIKDIVNHKKVCVSISQKEVKELDFKRIEIVIDALKKCNDLANNKLIVLFDYSLDDKEVYEIEEVRVFISKLFEKHNQIFYYLSYENMDTFSMFFVSLMHVKRVEDKSQHEKIVSFTANTEVANKIVDGIRDYMFKIHDYDTDKVCNIKNKFKEIYNVE